MAHQVLQLQAFWNAQVRSQHCFMTLSLIVIVYDKFDHKCFALLPILLQFGTGHRVFLCNGSYIGITLLVCNSLVLFYRSKSTYKCVCYSHSIRKYHHCYNGSPCSPGTGHRVLPTGVSEQWQCCSGGCNQVRNFHYVNHDSHIVDDKCAYGSIQMVKDSAKYILNGNFYSVWI